MEAAKQQASDIQSLSQKMSQLLTNTNRQKSTMLENIQDELNETTSYLTKQNKCFKQMIHQVLSTMKIATTQKNIEELRQIAILMTKTKLIQNYHILWTTYLKSGMGKLIMPPDKQLNYSTDLPIWPKEVIMTLRNPINLSDETKKNENYMKSVKNFIDELDKQLKQYANELNTRKNNFYGYTFTIQQMIEKYLEENLQSLRTETEHKVELVDYDYYIQALKIAYEQQNPNKYQKQLMKQLCASIYEQEITGQEFHLLQQQITYCKSFSESFECSPLFQSKLIDSIQNLHTREQLFKQYKDIAEQSKHMMLTLYVKTAQEQRDNCRMKLDTTMNKLWSDRQSHSDKNKISLIMVNLIGQRMNKIAERIQCVYKYQAFLQSDTHKNSASSCFFK
ncbi:unnamed protein product [Adineta ricciae]|uniref:Uncharacterized protein n=1 Tax=Adineta ricciae TaxID=249248 RepID=A0A814ZWT5_ADIRI|nr:unnamed protein product [Adineta ricciae]